MRVLVFVVGLLFVLIVSTCTPAFAAVRGQQVMGSSTAAWEAFLIFRPWAIYTGTSFMMWYSGESTIKVDNIGLATSTDGVKWMPSGPAPVLSVGVGSPTTGEWDAGSVNEPSVVSEGGTYKMWYTGQRYNPSNDTITAQAIGYATSPDGIHWTKYSGNPVLTASSFGEWDDKWVYMPTVISTGSSYVMYYRGISHDFNAQMGVATSSDGVNWTKKGVITLPHATWDANFRILSGIVKNGDNYAAVYYGNQASGQSDRIGAASSTDGMSFSPLPDNPLITYGTSGWDSGGIFWPMILIVGTNYYVYYTASVSGSNRRYFGLATLAMSQYPIPEFPSAMPLMVMALAIGVIFLSRKKLILSGSPR